MIIFGWGHQMIKNFGPTFRQHCSHCNNDEYWVLMRTMTWFTLFFIPVFPYLKKYFLTCPVCEYGFILDSEQTEKIKPLAEANQLLVDGKITEMEYKVQMNQLENRSPIPVEAELVEQKEFVGGNEEISFCSECGRKVTKKIKFCGYCGVKVAEK